MIRNPVSDKYFINKKLLFCHKGLKSLSEGRIDLWVSPCVDQSAFVFLSYDKAISACKFYRRKYLFVIACNCLDVLS